MNVRKKLQTQDFIFQCGYHEGFRGAAAIIGELMRRGYSLEIAFRLVCRWVNREVTGKIADNPLDVDLPFYLKRVMN